MPAELSPLEVLNPGWEDIELGPLLAHFETYGYARLPKLIAPHALSVLKAELDAITSGERDIRPYFFQHDAETGRYEDAPLGMGWVGPSERYRKIEKLERNPVVLAWLQNPFYARLAHAALGDGPIHLYRAIAMHKAPARDAQPGGTDLPWHQDGGRLWGLSENPRLQTWIALDPAPMAAGAMRLLAGSHKEGLATELGGKVPPELHAEIEARYPLVELPAEPGDCILLHSLVWHASGLNHTPHPRKALSAAYIPASTRCIRKRNARTFPLMFEGP